MRFKEFSGEWEKIELQHLCIFIKDGTHSSYINVDNGIPLLSAKDIYDNKIHIPANARKISIEDYKIIHKNYHFEVNDILLTIVGTVGRTAMITSLKESFTFQRSVSIIRINKKNNNPNYILYCLNSKQVENEIKSNVNQSAQGGIYLETLGKIKIPITIKNEQQKIANFLTLIDKRIETQMKIIEEYKSLMNSIVIKIFGDKSKFSNKWKKTILSEILTERKLYTQKNSKFTHVTLSKDGIIDKTDRYNRDFLVKDEEKEYKITKLNDICYNPANLKFGVICLNKYGDAIFSPIYVTYEINKNYNPHFIELALTNATFIGHIRKYEQGTVYERMAVSSEDFLKGYIWMPQKDEQDQIVNIINIINKINNIIHIEEKLLNHYKLQKNHLLNNMFI